MMIRHRSRSGEVQRRVQARGSRRVRTLDRCGREGRVVASGGLYSSHLVEWRRARDAGALKGLAAKTQPATRAPEQVELERARKKIARLEDDLTKHKLALEIQGKASELLERLLAESDETKKQQP